MNDIYEIIEEYNPDKKRKMLTILDDLIADMYRNKKLNSIVTELFVRGKKIKVSVLVTQSYFSVLINIKLKILRTILL